MHGVLERLEGESSEAAGCQHAHRSLDPISDSASESGSTSHFGGATTTTDEKKEEEQANTNYFKCE